MVVLYASFAVFLYQWLKLTADDVKEQIYKLAKKGLTPSQIGQYKTSKIIFMQEIKGRDWGLNLTWWSVVQIGVILRDSHGVAQVRYITGNKILRILKAKGMNFCCITIMDCRIEQSGFEYWERSLCCVLWQVRGANVWVILEVTTSIFMQLLWHAAMLFCWNVQPI